MADLLLVPDVGHGPWCWGKVWGYFTAPLEHPPKLYARSGVGKVVTLDLPGPGLSTGATGDRGPGLSLDDYARAVVGEVESHGLHNVIIVGHGLAAPIILRAAANLEEPPRRIVLFAGAIPDEGRSALDMFPRRNRLAFNLMARLNGRGKKEFRLPKAVISNAYCNGVDPFDTIQIVGRFTPVPLQLFRTKVYLNDLAVNCPVTYVPLWRDKLFPPEVQRRMARRLEGVEIAGELDSCHEVMIERPQQVVDILLKYV